MSSRITQIIPAADWWAVYDKERVPIACWALLDDEVVIGLVADLGVDRADLMPAMDWNDGAFHHYWRSGESVCIHKQAYAGTGPNHPDTTAEDPGWCWSCQGEIGTLAVTYSPGG